MRRHVGSSALALLLASIGACRSGPRPSPEWPPPPIARGDESRLDAVNDQVHYALNAAEALDSSHIIVVVAKNGVVYLSGTVSSEAERRKARAVAAGVPGVSRVFIDALEVNTAQALL